VPRARSPKGVASKKADEQKSGTVSTPRGALVLVYHSCRGVTKRTGGEQGGKSQKMRDAGGGISSC